MHWGILTRSQDVDERCDDVQRAHDVYARDACAHDVHGVLLRSSTDLVDELAQTN